MKRKMKRFNGEDGSQVEMDAMEAANKSEEAMDIADSMSRGSAGTSETVKATPKAMPKAAPKVTTKSTTVTKAESAPTSKAAATPVDETKLSLSDRMKLSRDRARAGTTTDMRSVSERLGSSRVPSSEEASANRSAAIDKVKGVGASISDYFRNFKTPAERRAQERSTKMASGGMTSSASKRADGIAVKGKTRGKMC